MADGGVLVQLRVTTPEAKFLEFIAERGGEIPWDWQRCRDDVTRMVRGMIDDKRMLAFLAAEGRLRLTDVGRSALAQIQQALRHMPRVPGA